MFRVPDLRNKILFTIFIIFIFRMGSHIPVPYVDFKAITRLKDAGRIEVLRERTANYHVFVFLVGARPNDDLITASLQEAGAPENEPTPAGNEPGKKTPAKKTPAKSEAKSRTAKKTNPKAKSTTSKSKAKKRR